MEQVRWKVGKVIDAHVHYRHREPAAYFNQILDMVGYSRANILTGWELRCLDRKREQPDPRRLLRPGVEDMICGPGKMVCSLYWKGVELEQKLRLEVI